jgi:Ras-related GTP-binding protein A/B
VRFLGNLVLNLWDCGGQEAFMENYFASQRDHIFRNVEVLIYVFDIESMDHDKDLRHYRSSLEAILENSKDAKVFCLIHKMDLVPEEQREEAFRRKEKELQGKAHAALTFLDLSIYLSIYRFIYLSVHLSIPIHPSRD